MKTLKEIMADKKAAIKDKKAAIKTSQGFGYSLPSREAVKMEGVDIDLKPGELLVKVIANMSMFVDTDQDVILPGAYTKSISERGSSIPFLHDHIHRAEARIGKTVKMQLEDVRLSNMGIETNKTTGEALVHYAKAIRDMNPSIYAQYENKVVDQHSIGLEYVQLDVASADEKYPKEFENWQKLLPLLINPQKAIEEGYFWIVKELKIRENSVVLWGANAMTPTLSIEEPSSQDTPPKSEEPSDLGTSKQNKTISVFEHLISSNNDTKRVS